MRLLVVGVALAALLVASGSHPAAQQGSTVRGRVEIGVPITARRPAAAYATRAITTATLAPISELRNVVVYLRDAPARAMRPVRAEIRQRDEHFIPRVLAIPVGSDVDFPNDDPIYHNVFSLSHAKTFNIGRYPQGRSKPVHFDKPGIVKVFCDIHSHMSATIIVFDNPWYAIPDENGRFELDDVPPGAREVTAWHERLGDTTLNLQIEAGRPATVDFTLPVPPK